MHVILKLFAHPCLPARSHHLCIAIAAAFLLPPNLIGWFDFLGMSFLSHCIIIIANMNIPLIANEKMLAGTASALHTCQLLSNVHKTMIDSQRLHYTTSLQAQYTCSHELSPSLLLSLSLFLKQTKKQTHTHNGNSMRLTSMRSEQCQKCIFPFVCTTCYFMSKLDMDE